MRMYVQAGMCMAPVDVAAFVVGLPLSEDVHQHFGRRPLHSAAPIRRLRHVGAHAEVGHFRNHVLGNEDVTVTYTRTRHVLTRTGAYVLATCLCVAMLTQRLKRDLAFASLRLSSRGVHVSRHFKH